MRFLLRPLSLHCASFRASSCASSTSSSSIIASTPIRHQHRTFLANLPTSPSQKQSISATRILPYPPTQLYNLISDIDSYSSFLPYVLSSTVLTRHPQTGAPTTADLRIGFPPFDETFTSKVTCVEPSLVEANAGGNENGVFESVRTRWEIRPEEVVNNNSNNNDINEIENSVVDLKIDIGFTSPLYAALTQAVIPKVAGVMIDSFEKRARQVLGEKNE